MEGGNTRVIKAEVRTLRGAYSLVSSLLFILSFTKFVVSSLQASFIIATP